MNRKITVLGSTGSIGTQTLDVIRHLNGAVEGLAAHRNTALLERQAREFCPRRVAVGDPDCYGALKTALADTDIEVSAGPQAVAALAAEPADAVLNAVVGIAGLESTLAALEAHNTLALANKESLVTGGELVMRRAKETKTPLLPVDSEHSAIFQCLNGENRDRIERIILTASGGPFFGRDRAFLASVTPDQALHHPNWSMGAKITVDSATLMNKGLELIEAMHLFSVRPEQIEIHVHRQSIIHSAVEFADGAVIAQLGTADMRIPIQYALTYPDRMPSLSKPLSLFDAGTLTFERPDPQAFCCLAAAVEAAKRGGLWPCAVNGANEAAVSLFLAGKLSFLSIGEMAQRALSLPLPVWDGSLSRIQETDRIAREMVRALA